MIINTGKIEIFSKFRLEFAEVFDCEVDTTLSSIVQNVYFV
jgi:hypothetical protein